MKDLNLVAVLGKTIKKPKGVFVCTPHPQKEFFIKRNITYGNIAKVMGVTSVAIGHWLNGRMPVPDKREVQFQELVERIKVWEEENGKLFNAIIEKPKPERHAIRKGK
jgi:pyruvate/2-oxoglutarate/acetoin dehydrogenase E1 component